MGLIYTDVTVQSLDGKGSSIDSSFLVDTGAVDCLMPTERLREVGIEPESTNVYELADGRVLELPVGWARLGFMGTVAIAKVVFGPHGSEPILGVIALETAGVALDPLTNTLKRLAKRSLKRSAPSLTGSPR
jgi:clan AA aspartic protease